MLATLPDAWFTNLPQWLLLLCVAASAAVLIRGADWLVENAAALAEKLGMPKVIVGATVVSLGTTSPEAAVSVLAAVSGNAGLALGNGIGSIITDTGLIFGLGCLLTPLPADRFILKRHGWVQLGAACLLAMLCYAAYALQGQNATLARPTGLLLVTLLIVYMALSIHWSRAHPQGQPHAEELPENNTRNRRSSLSLALWGLIGLALVLVAADTMVQSATQLALEWGVPDAVVAATIVAFGTSLPELVVGITSIRKGHPELLVGNIIGADILNVLFVIGVSALAQPLQIIGHGDSIVLYLHLPAMLVILILFRLFCLSALRTGRFKQWMGLPLITLFIAYVALQYILAIHKTLT